MSRLRLVSSLRRSTGGDVGDGVPQRGRRVVQPQVHVAVLGQRSEHLHPGGRQPAGAEHREPRRQVAQRRLVAQPRARVLEQLGRARRAERVAQPAPQLGLPAQILVERRAVAALVPPRRPRAQHLRPRLPVLVEHPGQPPRDREPPALVLAVAAEVLRQRPAPRLVGSHASMTSSSGHTARAGAHRSTASACSADDAASASSTSVLGHGKSTFAQTPSPVAAPSTCDSRWASHRSTPLAGTATTSAANGSAGGTASTSASPRASAVPLDARWVMSNGPPSGDDASGVAARAHRVAARAAARPGPRSPRRARQPCRG